MPKPREQFVVPSRNRILRTLSADEYRPLERHLKETPLDFKEILHEPGDRVDAVYFIERGVVSLVSLLEDGEIETGTIGYEGMIGVHGILGADTASERAICQVPGSARKLALGVLLRQPPEGPLFRRLLRYTDAILEMSAACNRAHSLEQRMCRWLLMTMDRAGRSEFPLTQEFLAQMLGVRRPSVSLVGSALQRAGLIQYKAENLQFWIAVGSRRRRASASRACNAPSTGRSMATRNARLARGAADADAFRSTYVS